MQITPKTTYAVRCLAYLKDRTDKLSALNDIAAGTVIPRPFLSKILQHTVRDGFVRSHKGRKGGFKLNRSPDKISMYDIALAASGGGSLLKTPCRDGRRRCGLHKTCKIRGIWEDIGKLAAMHLRSRKLSQL